MWGLVWLLGGVAPAPATTLQEAYDAAGPGAGYDKYVVLNTGATYTGGLWIGGSFNRITAEFEPGGEDVRIVGNGAILDLQGGEICIAYCNDRLDLDDCVIRQGNVRFRGYHDAHTTLNPQGSVRYVTFYGPDDYAVRLYNTGDGVLLERNLVVDVVDTGPDFVYLAGVPLDWLPTGTAFSLDANTAGRDVFHNWTYFTDPAANADTLRHYHQLCEYG